MRTGTWAVVTLTEALYCSLQGCDIWVRRAGCGWEMLGKMQDALFLLRLLGTLLQNTALSTNGIFHRPRANNFTIHMEIQKTLNSQSNLEKEEWNWRNQPA